MNGVNARKSPRADVTPSSLLFFEIYCGACKSAQKVTGDAGLDVYSCECGPDDYTCMCLTGIWIVFDCPSCKYHERIQL